MECLKDSGIYAIDGGFFKAHYNEEHAAFELWTYEGFSGHVIARTGFAIDPDGMLFHRIFDFETKEHTIFKSGFTVDELEEVDEAEFQGDPVEE